MAGISAYSTYLPYARLDRRAIAEALGVPPGKGARAVASHDEDTTSMGVEAARPLVAGRPQPSQLLFATADPAYLDKTNATAIHAALGLDESVGAYDVTGSVRSGVAAGRAAAANGTRSLVVFSDIRTGLPGGADERDGGDGAAALLFDDENVILEFVGMGSATGEFLDRWRTPGESYSRVWEERFGETAYLPLAVNAFTAACKDAGVTADEIDHVIITGVHPRAVRSTAKAIGVRPEVLADDLTAEIGYTGTPHRAIVLADVLDRATPGQTIALVTLADGADAAIGRTTDVLARYERSTTVRDQIAAGQPGLSYETFLTWRGQLRREPPRRPDPEAPAAPPSFRREEWKFGFTGSRCDSCGTRHLPPQRVCVNCRTVDQMSDERLADVPATVATFTVDRLAFSLSPPVVAAVIDFDGGGRFRCELTDVDPASVKIGDRVEMTFRRLFTAGNGVHNYFWKARPIRGEKG